MFRRKMSKKEKERYSLDLFRKNLALWNNRPPAVHPTLNIKLLVEIAQHLHQTVKANTQSTTAIGVTENGVWYVVTPKPKSLSTRMVSATIMEKMGLNVPEHHIVLLGFTASEFHAEIRTFVETAIGDKLTIVAPSQPCCTYCGGYLNYMQIPRPGTPGKLPLFSWRHPNSNHGFEPAATTGNSPVVEGEHALKGIRIPTPDNPFDIQAARKAEEVVRVCCQVLKVVKDKVHKDLAFSTIRAVSEMAVKVDSLSYEEKSDDGISALLTALEGYKESALNLMKEATAPTPVKYRSPQEKSKKKKKKNRNKKVLVENRTPATTPSKIFQGWTEQVDRSPLQEKNTPSPLRSYRTSPISSQASPEMIHERRNVTSSELEYVTRKLIFEPSLVGKNPAILLAARSHENIFGVAAVDKSSELTADIIVENGAKITSP